MKPIELTETELRDTEAALDAPSGDALMELMRDLSIGRPPQGANREAIDAAYALGWVRGEREKLELTAVGYVAADPLREYLYWVERNRRMPFEEIFPPLKQEAFDGKRFLEVGSGFGCNLLSLEGHAQHALGVDMVPLYLQLAPLLATRAGMTPPELLLGYAEALPAESESFDVVVCIGALQYMDIEKAVAEMARALVVGGHVILTLSHLMGHVRNEVARGRMLLRPRRLARSALELAGILAYPYLGRAFTPDHTNVYPSHHRMRRFLANAGLTWDSRTRVYANETFYLATKTRG